MAISKDKVQKEQLVDKKVKSRKLTDSTMVTVINNFGGILFYRSPRTHDEWIWAEYGDEHEMSIQELKTLKAQHRQFFADKWITFAEHEAEDVIKHLKIENYYKDGVSQDDWDSIFEQSVEELDHIISMATTNEKSLIINKARDKFESGELVNTHIIKLIEDKLHVDVDLNNPK